MGHGQDKEVSNFAKFNLQIFFASFGQCERISKFCGEDMIRWCDNSSFWTPFKNGRYTVFSFSSTCCYGTPFEANAAVTRWGRLRINHLRSVTTRPRPRSERNEEKSTRNCGNSSGDTRIGFPAKTGMSAFLVSKKGLEFVLLGCSKLVRPIPSIGCSKPLGSWFQTIVVVPNHNQQKCTRSENYLTICPTLYLFLNPTNLWSSFALTVK